MVAKERAAPMIRFPRNAYPFCRWAAMLGILLGGWAGGVYAQSNLTIYGEALAGDWANWSWATVNLAATTPVHAGSRAISVTAGGYQAFYVHTTAMYSGAYTGLTFWIHGGSAGGQPLQIQGMLAGAAQPAVGLPAPTAGTWKQVKIPLTTLGVASNSTFDGFWIQSTSGSAIPTFYVDDIQLLANTAVAAPLSAPVTITVDAAVNRRAISPLIYGVSAGDSNVLRTLRSPLNRHGGNLASRYNWLTNASNHAADWYFESLPQAGSGPGGAVDNLIRDSLNGEAAAMITIPINGWVAKLGNTGQRLSSYSIAKYGAQTGSDAQWFPDAGNGLRSATGQAITNNNPTDANMAVTTNFQAGWIRYLTNRWGSATHGGVRYYLMDNEWGLWHTTHRDVWPVGVTMNQARDLFCDYAAMVKSIDPQANILGPEEWGWTGFLYSGYDAQWGAQHGWGGTLPDRAAHGNMDFIPWWLGQVAQRSAAAGRRLLDVFTLHFYPQGGEFSEDVSSAMQLRRNRSTRALWDTNYVDETWIADRVALIPRMQNWVTNYPGTTLGLTEYNWGAENHMNGATAQAELLGIFGREGLTLANRWIAPGTNTPVARAFQLYRNYDGAHATFGDTSVATVAPLPDQLAAFGAQRTDDGALTVMLINKLPTSATSATSTTVLLSNVTHVGVARVWLLATNTITQLPDLSIQTNRLALILPAQSITLLVLPAPAQLELSAWPDSDGTLQLRGEAGQRYVMEASTNLTTWQRFLTNTLTSSTARIVLPRTPAACQFYRTVWAP
jgi:hypothetical protein